MMKPLSPRYVVRNSFKKFNFRPSKVVTRLNSLYKMTARMETSQAARNDRQETYANKFPGTSRQSALEQINISLVAYVWRKQLLECVNDQQLQDPSKKEIKCAYDISRHRLPLSRLIIDS